jgi:hypothetical protein
MKTTLYLATGSGLAVITGSAEDWHGKIRLEDKQIQCVVVDSNRTGVAYCGTFGDGMFRSQDGGTTWKAVGGFSEPNVMALASTHSGAVYSGTELSAIYRSDDSGETWNELHTLMTLPSAKGWSFPPRPNTHHVQTILPDLATPTRLHVAIEAGALVRSDDAGATWCDRVPGSPKDTHALAVHPQDPMRLHSAAGDGYFESIDDGESWRRTVDGLGHQYCWSIAISSVDPRTLLLTASNSAYGAHYKESAKSFVYRRSGNDSWQQVHDGLPSPDGLRIPVVTASRLDSGVFYCCADGRIFRSPDSGLKWQELAVQWESSISDDPAMNVAIEEEA